LQPPDSDQDDSQLPQSNAISYLSICDIQLIFTSKYLLQHNYAKKKPIFNKYVTNKVYIFRVKTAENCDDSLVKRFSCYW
jgi:hypothetical protein